MRSLILQTATRHLISLLLLFSVFLLLRGHNEPGGGFVAGLVGAAGFALYSLSSDVDTARRALQVDPHTLIGVGILVSLTSGLLALVMGEPLMSSYWAIVVLPLVGEFEIGTPIVFDIGVYLVVVGVVLLIVLSLSEE